MKSIKALLSGPAGDVSSKRVAGLILIIAGIVLAFIDHQADMMVGILIGGGTTILGVQAITKT